MDRYSRDRGYGQYGRQSSNTNQNAYPYYSYPYPPPPPPPSAPDSYNTPYYQNSQYQQPHSTWAAPINSQRYSEPPHQGHRSRRTWDTPRDHHTSRHHQHLQPQNDTPPTNWREARNRRKNQERNERFNDERRSDRWEERPAHSREAQQEEEMRSGLARNLRLANEVTSRHPKAQFPQRMDNASYGKPAWNRRGSRSPPPPTVSLNKDNLKPEGAFPRRPDPPMTVPDPTAEYLELANKEPKQNSNPSEILLILDLNETLVTRTKASVHKRPNLGPFLDYIFKNFYVMVWSSAQPVNVRKMVDTAFPKEYKKALRAVWARDMFGLTPRQYNAKVTTYKNLDRVWAALPGPTEGSKWNQYNTVLIDDSKEKARAQPYNHVEMPPWFNKAEEKNDKVLLEMVEYLEGLRFTDNVSAYIKQNPFVLKKGTEEAVSVSSRSSSPSGYPAADKE